MRQIVGRILAIRPGEEKKAALLLAIHLLFYLGLMWGGFAREALFIDTWGSGSLGPIFIWLAVLGFAMGLAYTFVADRVSNEKILYGLIALMAIWLASVWLFLENAPKTSLIYPYFYLVYIAFSDLSTLHILNYINDFYDTRSAKRALPVMLAAAVAGSAIAGFSFQYLRQQSLIGLANIPLIWIGLLALIVSLMLLARRLLPGEFAAIEAARQVNRRRIVRSEDKLDIGEGWRSIRQSSLLRWMALATFVMVILMNLLTFESSAVFESVYKNNRNGLSDFYANIDGISSVGSLIFQTLLLGRLIAWLGVGTLNMLFPVVTLASVGLLGAYPASRSAAIFARFDYKGIKQGLRNPLDALVYNSVPLDIKARAKGFIGGLVVPLGTLGSGLLVLMLRQFGAGWEAALMIGIGIGLVYILSAIRIRNEYSRSLSTLLQEDEMSIFQLEDAGFSDTDAATLGVLYQRIESSRDDTATIFLCEILYHTQGRDALLFLEKIAAERSHTVRAGIIRLLGRDRVDDHILRTLCLDSLRHDEAELRHAALEALVNIPGASQDDALQAVFLERLHDPDETIQAIVIPPLIASGDFYFLAPAVQQLNAWLGDHSNPARRAAGLTVLARTGAERLAYTLIRYLDDPASMVRRQAVSLIDDLTAQTPLQDIRRLGIETLHRLLADHDESVRLAAATGLGHFGSLESSRALLTAFSDTSFAVRRMVCSAIRPAPQPELEALLDSDSNLIAECAAYVLARAGSRRAARRILDLMGDLAPQAYQFHADRLALARLETPGANLFKDLLAEQSAVTIERIFWLMGAISSEDEVRSIRRSLESPAAVMRANAAEMLESITTPQFARLLTPLFEERALDTLVAKGIQSAEVEVPDEWEIIGSAWPFLAQTGPAMDMAALAAPQRAIVRLMLREGEMTDGELHSAAARLPGLSHLSKPEIGDAVQMLLDHGWLRKKDSDNNPRYEITAPSGADQEHAAVIRTPAARNLAALYQDGLITAIMMRLVWEENAARRAALQEPLVPIHTFYDALRTTLEDSNPPLVAETARDILALIDAQDDKPKTTDSEGPMLSTIEKLIFLKEVPFFQGMTIDQLRVIASISEEAMYGADQTIIGEGNYGDTLFLIIEGKVGIQRQTTGQRDTSVIRLATLGRKEYFAEMSIFDNQPYSADAVTIEPTLLLLVRQQPLVALIQSQPSLALDLLKVMSLRLRQANEMIADKTKVRTKKLMDFYDQMEE